MWKLNLNNCVNSFCYAQANHGVGEMICAIWTHAFREPRLIQSGELCEICQKVNDWGRKMGFEINLIEARSAIYP